MTARAGRTVGRYRILRVIGRGGMATVYLARQTDLDREVALKELALGEASGDAARRFLREARLAGSLAHPNLVTVHDYLERKGTPYIAMEYLPRGSLRPYLGRTSLAQAGGVLHGVLSGLGHAHERAIVHRDIKPENIMVTGQGAVKIADFGIAKAVDATRTSASLTTAGTTLGTPRYMSPERAMGQAIGPWSDLYSVGALAFEMLVGRPPFDDTAEPMAILLRQINEPIPPARSLVPAIDSELSDWIGRLLEKDSGARTQSAAAAADELDEILSAVLGPRWLRDAALPATPPARAPAIVASPRVPVMTRSVPTTERGVPTVAPPAVAPPTVPLPRRRRWRRGPVVVVASAGLVIVAVAAHGIQRPGAGSPAPVSDAVGGVHEVQASGPAPRTPVRDSAPASREQRALALARDYANSARRARALAPTASNLRQASTLEQIAAAYQDAADGARRNDGSDYDDAMARAAAGVAALKHQAAPQAGGSSGVGDSRSDDPSDDEPDENDNGD